MRWIRRVVHRLMRLVGRAPVERELDDEVNEYVRLLTEEKLASGLDPAAARRAALMEVGGVEQVKESVRSVRAGQAIEVMVRDLRQGFRSLMRTPGFTIAALVALALGVGASTAVFSVVDAVLLRPLGYAEPDRLVVLLHESAGPVSPANYLDWQQQSKSFEAMGAAEYWTADLTGEEQPERLRGLRLTPEVLPMLGVQPLLGRMLAQAEGEVVLSYRLWQRRWAGDPGVLGRAIQLNGSPYTIVGVMPEGFEFAPFWATDRDVWSTVSLSGRETNRGARSLRVFARLARSVSVRQARAEIATITGRLEQAYPATNRNVTVTPLTDMVVSGVRPALLVLMGAVALLLLIACANVAHMMLARATSRAKELNVRSALGAGRGRIVLHFMTESLVLAIGGCSLGLALAVVTTRALRVLGAASIPRIGEVVLDARAVAFAIAVSLLTGVVFGLVPLFQVTGSSPASSLRDESRGSTAGGRLHHARHVLVATEFALALVLLTGAGLLLRSFVALQAYDPGFVPDHVLSMVVSIQGSAEAVPGRRATFYHDLLERARRLPGVEAAGAINHLPLAGDIWGLSFFIEGRARPQPGEKPGATYRVVLPGYFETMRLPILRGRAIDATDDERATGVVVINESLANRWWPAGSALGQRISFADPDVAPRWLTVVGVTKDAATDRWGAEPGPELYLSMPQVADFMTGTASHFTYITLVVRAAADPAAVAPAVRDLVWSFDRKLPISEEQTMTHVVGQATAQPRFNAMLLASFAAVALCIAAVGIYGVMSYVVSRRTREIGIRMALGARDTQIVGLVVRQGVMVAVAGALAGLAGALLLRSVMASLLYGIGPADPLTFTLVPLVLTAVAATASWVPARRALAMNPVAALRDE
jgi:putative ABC transport system permease protein